MLLQGSKKTHDNLLKINAIPDFAIEQSGQSFIPYRHAFTAKLKSRHSQITHIKATSIKPFHSNQTYINVAEAHVDPFSKDQITSLRTSQNITQFDNLQLQDFVKMAIIGQNQDITTKSKQIIRSLNGTWFKSTHSEDLSSHKLYNNLGIKRTKMLYKMIKHNTKQPPVQREIFKNEYTPPNIFPQRKQSPRRNQVSKSSQAPANNVSQITDRYSPLKDSILRKSSQSKRSLKRSSTSLTSKTLKNASLFEQTGFLLGRKIVLHNQ